MTRKLWGGKSALFFGLFLLFGIGYSHTTQAQVVTADWKGVDPSTAATAGDTVFIYNVGKKQFLGRGGHWGTEAVLSDVGQEFIITTNGSGYKLATQTRAEGSTTSSTGYLFQVGTDSSHDALNYFTDNTSVCTLNFESVTDATSSDKKIYHIKSYLGTATSGTQYYMVAGYNTTDQITNSWSSGQSKTHKGSTSDTSNLSIIVNAFSSISNMGDSCQWILVNKEERRQFMRDNAENMSVYVPATFLMADNDFARKDQAITNWDKLVDGTETAFSKTDADPKTATVPTSSTTTSYYVGNGNADNADGQLTDGGRWTMNIHGASGSVTQTVSDIFQKGWYEIRCNAFVTTTSTNTPTCQLFIKAFDKNETETEYTTESASSLKYQAIDVVPCTDRPSDYVAAAKLVNDEGTTTTSHTIKARVFVDRLKQQTQDYETSSYMEILKFGVNVSGGDETTWVCMDNFELFYEGTVTDDLILDEDKTDVSYMNSQNNNVVQQRRNNVYLKRDLKKGQWNTVILPVTLLYGDVKQIWGNDVQVTKFVGASKDRKNIIDFVSTKEGLKAGCLYLIKPSSLNTTTLKETVTSSRAENVSLAQGTECYTLEGVFYGLDKDDKVIESYTASIEGDTGAARYDDNEKVQFYGTYTTQKSCVATGSYYINPSDGKFYYLTEKAKPMSSKGFRGWLRPVENSTGAKQMSFAIDGVDATGDNGTTGIEELILSPEEAVLNGQNNVYSVSGQLVRRAATSLSGLPQGLYIVGGKKIAVK